MMISLCRFSTTTTTTTSFKSTIQKSILSALKQSDSTKASVLKQVYNELITAEKIPKEQKIPTEIEVIKRCIKKWHGAIEDYQKLLINFKKVDDAAQETIEMQQQRHKIQEIIKKEQYELQIIQSLLPPPYSTDELEQIISSILAKSNTGSPSNLGNIMKLALEQLDASKTDTKQLLSIIRSKLNTCAQ